MFTKSHAINQSKVAWCLYQKQNPLQLLAAGFLSAVLFATGRRLHIAFVFRGTVARFVGSWPVCGMQRALCCHNQLYITVGACFFAAYRAQSKPIVHTGCKVFDCVFCL